jgi:hypothetical protein
MKIRTAIIALCAGFILASCGTTPPVSSTAKSQSRSVPRDLEERFVYQMVFSLRDSFVSRDGAAFMRHVSEGFYMGRERLARNLEAEFAATGDEALDVDIIDVIVDDPSVTAVVSWVRTPAGGVAPPKAGTTELIFQKGDTLSLVNFRKDVLFGITGF